MSGNQCDMCNNLVYDEDEEEYEEETVNEDTVDEEIDEDEE